MSRQLFLTLAACVALLIGTIALFFPAILLVEMKASTPNAVAIVMARTVGALLLSFGALNFMIRNDEPSKTLSKVLLANIILQAIILPIDPLAYFAGTYGSLGSFIPNTILHLVLIAGFFHFWRQVNSQIS